MKYKFRQIIVGGKHYVRTEDVIKLLKDIMESYKWLVSNVREYRHLLEKVDKNIEQIKIFDAFQKNCGKICKKQK